MRVLVVFIVFLAISVFQVNAEVFWYEAEEYDEEKSNPTFNDKGLNVAWTIKADKEAFNEQYINPTGANRDTVEAAAGLVYLIPEVDKPNGWKLWIRCIMATTGSDSVFHQISDDGGEKWSAVTADHGGAQWFDWEWHSWDLGSLKKGDENALRIAERENNASLDVICLRNDAMVPTDEEYEAYLVVLAEKPDIAVDAKDKLAGSWGDIKSRISLER